MTIDGVVKCLPELVQLIRTENKAEQRKLILKCRSCIIYAISEICKNILNGNIPLSSKEKKQLQKHKASVRKLSNKSVTLEDRRKTINQVGGALPALLIPAISLLGSIIASKL